MMKMTSSEHMIKKKWIQDGKINDLLKKEKTIDWFFPFPSSFIFCFYFWFFIKKDNKLLGSRCKSCSCEKHPHDTGGLPWPPAFHQQWVLTAPWALRVLPSRPSLTMLPLCPPLLWAPPCWQGLGVARPVCDTSDWFMIQLFNAISMRFLSFSERCVDQGFQWLDQPNILMHVDEICDL